MKANRIMIYPNEITIGLIFMKKKVYEELPSKSSTCSPNTSLLEHQDCSIKRYIDFWGTNGLCIPRYIKNFEKENREMEYCNNVTEEVKPSHLAYSSIPYTDIRCPLPCSQVTYEATYGAMSAYENDNDDRVCKGTGMSELHFTFSSMNFDYFKAGARIRL